MIIYLVHEYIFEYNNEISNSAIVQFKIIGKQFVKNIYNI